MKVYNQEKRIFEIQEYVEKEDSGWITLIYGVKYRKSNGIVTIRFNTDFASGPITEPWQRIATIPKEYRPNEVIFFNGCTNDIPTRVIGIMVSEIGNICLLAPIPITTISVLASAMYQV